MLERMENQGLIKRIDGVKDKRETLIALTDKAKLLQNDYYDVTNRMEKIFYRNFNESEIKNFENILKKIIENLEVKNAR